MPEPYTVRQDHLSVDLVLWRRHGRRGQDLVGQTLSLNPGLGALGPILPLGTVFLIPDLPRDAGPAVAQPIDLFG